MNLNPPLVRLEIRSLPQLWLDLRPFGYSDAFRDVMRTVPGATWNLTTRSYMLPEEAWPCMEPVIRSGLAEVTSDQRKTHPALAKVLPPGVIDDALHSYQIEGAAFLYQRISATGSALLGDDPGLGKTVQAITVAKALEADRLIIIAPAVVLRHWEAELLKWWPTMCCHVLDSRKSLKTLQETVAAANAEENLFDKLRLKADLYDNMAWILSYDFLRSNEEALLQVLPEAHGVFLDEIHYIQNAKSKRSKAVATLVHKNRKANAFTIGMSGTPMTARPRDLWHSLNVLFPDRFGRFIPFAVRYCDGHQEDVTMERSVWITDGSSNEEELSKRLRHLMIRRSRIDVRKDLPERNRIVIPVEPPPSKRKKLADIVVEKGDPASMRKALALIEKFKVDAAIDLAEDLITQGSKVLVYTMTRAHAGTIAEALGVEAITGEVPAKDRRPKLQTSCDFAGCGVATMFSVTTGIDLTMFDSVIFVGLDWVPANLLQAEARAHRIGQLMNVNIYYLIAMGTVDEAIREKVIWRLDTFGAILGGAAEQKRMRKDLRQYSDEQLLDQIVAMVMKGES